MTVQLDHIHPTLTEFAFPLEQVTLDPKNARKHSDENIAAIRESLSKHGARRLIVLQRKGAAFICRTGNGRVVAARELMWSHFPALVIDEDDDIATAFAIADNRTAELAEWDYTILASLTSHIERAIDLSDTGAASDEYERKLLAAISDGMVAPKVFDPEVIDPESLGDYDEETDFYVVKIESVPIRHRDSVLQAVRSVVAAFSDQCELKVKIVEVVD